MNSRTKTWTNSFIRIYPKLTTIEHNKTYFVGKSLNPPQQGSLCQPRPVNGQVSNLNWTVINYPGGINCCRFSSGPRKIFLFLQINFLSSIISPPGGHHQVWERREDGLRMVVCDCWSRVISAVTIKSGSRGELLLWCQISRGESGTSICHVSRQHHL